MRGAEEMEPPQPRVHVHTHLPPEQLPVAVVRIGDISLIASKVSTGALQGGSYQPSPPKNKIKKKNQIVCHSADHSPVPATLIWHFSAQ